MTSCAQFQLFWVNFYTYNMIMFKLTKSISHIPNYSPWMCEVRKTHRLRYMYSMQNACCICPWRKFGNLKKSVTAKRKRNWQQDFLKQWTTRFALFFTVVRRKWVQHAISYGRCNMQRGGDAQWSHFDFKKNLTHLHSAYALVLHKIHLLLDRFIIRN